MHKNPKLADLLLKLSSRPSTSIVYNPYENEYALNNLKRYFDHFLNNPFRYILIGEAPGHDGCRWTGIPFTSGHVIRNCKHRIFSQDNSDYCLEKVIKESTATVVWEYLSEIEELPLFWNSFPFHPHAENNCNNNRLPGKNEIKEGAEYLNLIFEIFSKKTVYSLGRVSEKTMKVNFPALKSNYIRHPSRGGKPKFIEGMNLLYA